MRDYRLKVAWFWDHKVSLISFCKIGFNWLCAFYRIILTNHFLIIWLLSNNFSRIIIIMHVLNILLFFPAPFCEPYYFISSNWWSCIKDFKFHALNLYVYLYQFIISPKPSGIFEYLFLSPWLYYPATNYRANPISLNFYYMQSQMFLL